MDQEEFSQLNARRMESMLRNFWPQIESRLAQSLTPKQIADELGAEGYWGFTSNRIGVNDIHRIWQEALKERP